MKYNAQVRYERDIHKMPRQTPHETGHSHTSLRETHTRYMQYTTNANTTRVEFISRVSRNTIHAQVSEGETRMHLDTYETQSREILGAR